MNDNFSPMQNWIARFDTSCPQSTADVQRTEIQKWTDRHDDDRCVMRCSLRLKHVYEIHMPLW